MKFLTAIPVYNEERHLRAVLEEVRRYSPHILVVNDGSTDGTAPSPAFAYTLGQDVDVLVTMDCAGQPEPARIPVLLEAIHDADIVSGSRYLRDFRQDTHAPRDRQRINGI